MCGVGWVGEWVCGVDGCRCRCRCVCGCACTCVCVGVDVWCVCVDDLLLRVDAGSSFGQLLRKREINNLAKLRYSA